ncbi:phosphonate metabolism protein/1,5-bisphosphokinase (PRPP-forming) PhnN [Pseudomonas sp. TWR2-1-1]|uniref:phosphonate metabolism protein/1,5-bisphosphokinase (PRPP-forming) PhnN n=1 Tax=Pseudomonas sp. TWR2-1-1 TaxID=2804610 RepID=UPI003CF04DCD
MPGKLIYLMGPSGSGKDSLIDAVRPYLPERGCEVIRRVITRSSEAVGEDALGVSHERFQSLKEEGAFAMHWQANGLEYGIPVEIDQWLNSGRHVLVNGSRGYLKQARERYPDLLAIMLYVDTGVLRQRLQARGRETPAEISDRLQRNQLFIDSIDEQQSEQVSVLNNSAALSLGVQGFLALIDASLAPAAHSA